MSRRRIGLIASMMVLLGAGAWWILAFPGERGRSGSGSLRAAPAGASNAGETIAAVAEGSALAETPPAGDPESTGSDPSEPREPAPEPSGAQSGASSAATAEVPRERRPPRPKQATQHPRGDASKKTQRHPTDCKIVLIDKAGRSLSEGWITCVESPESNQAIQLRLAQEWHFGLVNLDDLLDEQGRRIEADESGTAHIGDPSEGNTCAIVRAEAPGLVKYAFVNLAYSPHWTLTLEAPERVTIRVRARGAARLGGVPIRLETEKRGGGYPVWTGSLPPYEAALELAYPIQDVGLRRVDGDMMSHDRLQATATFDFPCLDGYVPPIDPKKPEVDLVLPRTGSMTIEFELGTSTGSYMPAFALITAAKPGAARDRGASLHVYRVAGPELQLPWIEVGVDLHVALVPAGLELWNRGALEELFAKGVVLAGPSAADQHVRRTVVPP